MSGLFARYRLSIDRLLMNGVEDKLIFFISSDSVLLDLVEVIEPPKFAGALHVCVLNMCLRILTRSCSLEPIFRKLITVRQGDDYENCVEMCLKKSETGSCFI